MELGSQVCKPVNPLCSECPLQNGCKAYAEVCLAFPIDDQSDVADQCTAVKYFRRRMFLVRSDTHCF